MTQKQTSNSTASSVFVMGARKRLLAFLLDGVLATMMVLLIPFDALNGERLPGSLSEWMASTLWLPDLLWFLTTIGSVLFVMGTAMETLVGWTPGKKVCGGRVVRRSGGKSGVIRNIIRNGMKGLSLALLGLGQLWAFFDKDRRTLYDRLTGVMVIRTGRPAP